MTTRASCTIARCHIEEDNNEQTATPARARRRAAAAVPAEPSARAELMATAAPKTYTEQHKVAVTDVGYGLCYSELCERFYGRCDFGLNLLQIAAASTTVAGTFGKVPAWLSVMSAAAIALIGIAGMLWSPAARAERHKAAKDAFIDLKAKAWNVSTTQLLRELASAQKAAPTGPRSLEMPAFNRNIRSIGVTPTEELGPLESLFDMIA